MEFSLNRIFVDLGVTVVVSTFAVVVVLFPLLGCSNFCCSDLHFPPQHIGY